jgi:hypothetical protein
VGKAKMENKGLGFGKTSALLPVEGCTGGKTKTDRAGSQ